MKLKSGFAEEPKSYTTPFSFIRNFFLREYYTYYNDNEI